MRSIYADMMISLLSLAAWIFLLLFHGRFWRADQRLSPDAPAPESWPGIVAVIPARDEAETIGEVVTAHRATDYPGGYPVIVVDDASSDGTAALARDAGATVVAAPPLASGWTGKLWALQTGIAEAKTHSPAARYLLLTDADIVHARGTARQLVAKSMSDGHHLVSLMSRLDSRGFWGHLLIPAFVFFFQKLYPFPLVNKPTSKVAGAAGGCVLIDVVALEEIGGIAALRDALIDDCTLAALVKHGPPSRSIWLGLADDEVVSRRDNRALASIWHMVRRTAFTQLRHAVPLLIGSVAGMFLVYLWPVIGLALGVLRGDAIMALTAGAAWLAMAVAYWPTLRLYRIPAFWALLLPLAAFLYTLMTLDSARHHFSGRGGAWKGRTYP